MRDLQTLFLLAVGFSTVSVAKPTAQPRCPTNDLEIQTSSGVVFGAINGITPRVRAFLGIPYAEPPVGPLRWLPAIALNSTNRTINASQFGPSCPQNYALRDIYSTEIPEFLVDGPMSEDCLSLSVWAPANPKNTSLPVFIWIHGGGFNFGSASVPYQIPAKWVQRTQSHIVVSIQYRLNILGFPNAAGLEHNNLGLMDQRLAIEWVQHNIKSFGGDPQHMVLWGQSAGGNSVQIQNYAYPNDPIVNGFISDSGSEFLPGYSPDLTQTNFSSVARIFDCSYPENATATLDCMRRINTTALTDVVKANGSSPYSFIPVPDEVIVFSNYTARAFANQLSSRPAIYGSTLNETTSLVPFPADPLTSSLNLTLVEKLNAVTFICPQRQSSQVRQAVSRKTYRYRYHGNFANISPLPWLGAYHCSELPLIFGTEGDYRGPATSLEAATSKAMQDRWLAFAKDPDHGLEEMGWMDYSSGNVETFAADGIAVQDAPVSNVDALCPT
ncbi:hypothetical protein AAFC00_002395 [Neodothiora populina]|uniref:Carboxylic ester hydrolase n=1 Tax=Neodothiora populina TaxID=2781224 RepID=A0ABR3P7A4_9PEZI